MIDVGTTVAGYRLEELLSTDTVSTIYRARGERQAPAREVTLRITHTQAAADGHSDPVMAAYARRVTTVATIASPVLVPVLDVGMHGDQVYVATAPVDGVTLEQYIHDHGRLAGDDAVRLFADVSDALDLLHTAGIVHGAIGPRTIWIGSTPGGADSDVAVLEGFGLDVLLQGVGTRDRADIDATDLAYMSPELLRGEEIDGRADQYAVACALYHCIAGRPPFQRDTAVGMIGAHLFSAAAIGAAADADRAMAAALLVGLAKQTAHRHDSCVDLLRATGHAPRFGTWSATPPSDGARRSRGARRKFVAHSADLRPAVGVRPRRRDVDPPDQHLGRLAIGWPVAAMIVLLGMIATLVVVTAARGPRIGVPGFVIDPGQRVTPAPQPAAEAGPAAAGIRWQRVVADESIRDVIVAGTTVVAAAPHRVSALDGATGATAWTRSIDVGVLTDMAATDDIVAIREARFRGLATSDGTRRWQQGDIVAPISSIATAGSTIFGIAASGVATELLALDAATGARRWSFDGGGRRLDAAAVVEARGAIVAVVDSDTLWVLDPTGPTRPVPGSFAGSEPRARWQLQLDEPWLDSLALLPDVVVVARRSGQVCAYDPADGAQRWCAPVAGVADQAPIIIAERDAVVVVSGSRVLALSVESGARRWVFESPRALTPIAAGSRRQVIVSDVGGSAHGLDLRTGHEVWRASGFGEITALAQESDAVYVGTRAGLLVHVQPPLDPVA